MSCFAIRSDRGVTWYMTGNIESVISRFKSLNVGRITSIRHIDVYTFGDNDDAN